MSHTLLQPHHGCVPEATIPRDFRLPLECPARSYFLSRRSDEYVLEAMLRWFSERLPCVAGRREFNRGRYMIEIARAATVPAIFGAFVSAVRSYENTACLFIFNEPEFYDGNADARSAFQYLAGQMAQLGDSDPDDLADGEALSNTITLKCRSPESRPTSTTSNASPFARNPPTSTTLCTTH